MSDRDDRRHRVPWRRLNDGYRASRTTPADEAAEDIRRWHRDVRVPWAKCREARRAPDARSPSRLDDGDGRAHNGSASASRQCAEDMLEQMNTRTIAILALIIAVIVLLIILL